MKTLLLFGGTQEGRELAEALSQKELSLIVSVATDYGHRLLPRLPRAHIRTGPLDEAGMLALMEERGVGLVADATHPYAREASETIARAAAQHGVPLLRLVRPGSLPSGGVTVNGAAEAADYLETTAGNILLATGAKELPVFAGRPGLLGRLFVRVLPAVESLERCRALGIPPGRILAMQGPFSAGFNRELMGQWEIRTLVTKDGGAPGGFAEKARAAGELGVALVVIGRPGAEQGLTPGELLAAVDRWLKEKL